MGKYTFYAKANNEGKMIRGPRKLPPKGEVFEGVCNFSELSDMERIERFSWYPVEGLLYNKLTHTRSESYVLLPDKFEYTITPRPEEEVLSERKLRSISAIKDGAKKKLDKTDWKVVRHLEEKATGQTTTLSTEDFTTLTEGRSRIRVEAKNRINQISLCSDTEQLSTLLNSWAEWI